MKTRLAKTRLAAMGAILLTFGILLTIGKSANAHRLDEYLQATTLSIEPDRVQAQIRLTPGVAVFPSVFASMDTNGDGILSAAEQRAYAEQVSRDLSFTLDSERLLLRLDSWKFAKTAEMKEGRGDIQLDFTTDAPHHISSRKLIFENHHQSRVAVYLVNCLVPRDPNIQVRTQHRNYRQSSYELDYTQVGSPASQSSPVRPSGIPAWLGATALLLFVPFAWLWRHTRAAKSLLLFALLVPALPAQAHPLPLSYIDLRLNHAGVEASVEVPVADLTHDLPQFSAQSLLMSDTLKAHRQEIATLLTSRLTLGIAGASGTSGKVLSPRLESIVPVPDQKDVRLRLRYAWQEPPATLSIQCRLFPYDPAHQTYVDVYEEGVLKREMIFDTHTPQQDYARGSHQSVILVVRQFLVQGIWHIFTGLDHILFIVGLLLLGGTLKGLLKIVTAFTVAHSVTLCLATLNLLNPPARIIEPTIALSIVFVGVHSMIMRKKPSSEKSLPDMRLLFAFGFGFIHGFGFANALQELELPRQALVAALFSFNLGVECGQACIVLAVAPLLALLHRKNDRIAQGFVTAGSLGVIVAGGFWFVQRLLAG